MTANFKALLYGTQHLHIPRHRLNLLKKFYWWYHRRGEQLKFYPQGQGKEALYNWSGLAPSLLQINVPEKVI